ncbi:MAG: phospho-sugar mutase [Deltaproteobacteria bacterium]|nr:MAG: phospho-sugar mutase [Deltaproteobacteria bacterium]
MAPHDVAVMAHVARLQGESIRCMPLSQARSDGLLEDVGEEICAAYLRGVQRVSSIPALDDAARAAVKIAYTPLHGVGAPLTQRALRNAGYLAVETVASQELPDGDFPTVSFPNPEEPGAMDAVLDLARHTQAHLACASDPDADRFAVAVRHPDGNYRRLSGNEVGFLLADMFARQSYGRGVMATTVVSSRLLSQICQATKLRYFETLTGFKYIANGALAAQARGDKFLFAYEEALGYSIGDLVWDKDGISAMCAFCELFTALQMAGSNIFKQLEHIYRQYGLYLDGHANLKLADELDPAAPSLCDKLRRVKPQSIAEQTIIEVQDLRAAPPRSPFGGANLPPSDVLVYQLQDGSRVIVRPSGTEPKVKCYYEVVSKLAPDEPFETAYLTAQSRLTKLIDSHQAALANL